MRTHVHTLRRKLTAVGFQDAVESLRGVGYRVTEAFRV
ncbi:MAG: helix-turn-helix domain-containing protein [Dehalococcoidia bacterium]